MNARQWLETLVAMDTTSRNSNLELIETVRDWLKQQGVSSWLATNPEGNKANLFATLPAQDGQTEGGVVLSGHTDVVPVDNQDWRSNPFQVTERDGRLYGRGTCDMKGYLAVALSLVPEFLAMPRKKPIHLALSYDEEVGCMGAPGMLAEIAARGIVPEGCIVGEPTDMKPVVAHKGINVYRCCVQGKAAHSSLTPHGSNAIEYAARLICHIRDQADRLRANGPYDELFDVPFSTMTTNLIRGGNAVNTIPVDCEFVYEFRNLPAMSVDSIQGEVERYAREELLPRMRAEFDGADIRITNDGAAPAFQATENSAIGELVRALTEDRKVRKVGYATEAGLFENIRIPTVVCGPGSIEQAHRPDEFVSLEQFERCEHFLRRVGQSL